MEVLEIDGVSMKLSTNPNPKKAKRHTLDGLCRYAEFLNYGDFHVKFDPASGLRAIVAIHNLKRGPAIGGCRLFPYNTTNAALEDVLRLGYMMSYKAAINNLNHGGGKSVILMPKEIRDRDAFFEAFGSFVNELGGRYITAVDSGTGPAEMDIIARKTPFVTCTSNSGNASDPSPQTAFGVRRAIEASVKFQMKRDNLDGVHVTIQGAGHVGYYLAKELHALGARITMCDIKEKNLLRCVEEFGVEVVAPDAIYDVQADVFAPCAMGSILNMDTIKRLKTSIVAGSANNQLAHRKYGKVMQSKGILYAPDFLINAGGLIHVAVIYDHADVQKSEEQISNIYHTVTEIYEIAKAENTSTNLVAERIARERLK